MMWRRATWLIFLVALAGLAACGRGKAPLPPAELVRVEAIQAGELSDDLDQASLTRAIDYSLNYLGRLPPERVFRFGPDSCTAVDLIATLEEVSRLLDLYGLGPAFFNTLAADFQFYAPPDEVLFTGYYEPLLEGRMRPQGRLTQSLYAVPEDLVSLNLKDFGLDSKIIRGRLEGKRVKPYPSRAEIEAGALDGQGLELVYVDPVEAFFLHIQGSGRVRLPDGEEILINYAGQNGRSYVSLGRVMIERGLLDREEVSLQSIKAYLADHPDEAAELLNTNPSFVFFRVVEEGPLGCLNQPLTPLRSIALDRRIYPDAALGLIQTSKPLIAGGQIVGWEPFTRLVLIQDTGGAIKGPHRADLFFGHGPEAEIGAGYMKQEGRLFVLLPKEFADR